MQRTSNYAWTKLADVAKQKKTMWKDKSRELFGYWATCPFKIQTHGGVEAGGPRHICVPNKVEICAGAQSHTTLPCDWVDRPSAVPSELIGSALKIYKYLHDWIQTHEYISQTGFLESYFTSWRLPLAALREGKKKRSSVTSADKKVARFCSKLGGRGNKKRINDWINDSRSPLPSLNACKFAKKAMWVTNSRDKISIKLTRHSAALSDGEWQRGVICFGNYTRLFGGQTSRLYPRAKPPTNRNPAILLPMYFHPQEFFFFQLLVEN